MKLKKRILIEYDNLYGIFTVYAYVFFEKKFMLLFSKDELNCSKVTVAVYIVMEILFFDLSSHQRIL